MKATPALSALRSRVRSSLFRTAGAAALWLIADLAGAQTYGFATLQPGSLSYSMASAIAKVFKDSAGMNILVQPQGGDNVLVPMVSRGEIDLGIASAPELHAQAAAGRLPDLRLIGTINPLRLGVWVRKDAPMRTIADLKGKRVPMGYSAMRVIDDITRAILASGGLIETDVQPVLVPNVNRGAEEFVAGATDAFSHAFGAPKVRESDASVGGIRELEFDEKGMAAARKISPWGYLSQVDPGPVNIGVTQPMKVYTFDNLLFTSAKVADEFVYKFIESLEKNKAELVKLQPVLGEFAAAVAYKKYGIPYHPGALKYFQANSIQARPL